MEKKNKNSPFISVVLPVHNIEEYLGESIESILNQTFRDFELIIIFNGTTDSSAKIAKRYSQNDKRIKLIYLSEPNVQKAMNVGLKISQGKYIARMDGDDLCFSKRFECQVKYLETHPEIFLVGSSAEIIDEKGRKIGVFRKYNSWKKTKRKLKKSNCIIHPSIMFRNTNEFFYREEFKTSEDYDFYLRMLSSGKKLTNLPKILFKYRIRGNSFVSTKPCQEFFFQKARKLYFQRKSFGYEKDNDFNCINKKSTIPDFNKLDLGVKVTSKFQDNQMCEARKNIKIYFKKYGFDKTFFIYYLISYLPKKIIFMMRKVL